MKPIKGDRQCLDCAEELEPLPNPDYGRCPRCSIVHYIPAIADIVRYRLQRNDGSKDG